MAEEIWPKSTMVCFPDSSPSLLTCYFLYGCYNTGLEQTPCSGLTVGFMAKGSVTLRPKFLHWSKREELAGLYTRPSQIMWVSDIQGTQLWESSQISLCMGFGQGCDPAARTPESQIIISSGYHQRANIRQGQLTKISSRERVLFVLILEFGNHGLQENINSSYGW
jgi:hypothetical protein